MNTTQIPIQFLGVHQRCFNHSTNLTPLSEIFPPKKKWRGFCSLIKLDGYPTFWSGRMTNEILSRLVTTTDYLLQTNTDQQRWELQCGERNALCSRSVCRRWQNILKQDLSLFEWCLKVYYICRIKSQIEKNSKFNFDFRNCKICSWNFQWICQLL